MPLTSHAATFTGNANGLFGVPTPSDGGVVFDGVGTNRFLTGTPLEPRFTENIYTVSGSAFDVSEGTQFALADLSFLNGVAEEGSVVSSVPIDISVSFDGPIPFTETFNYAFEFDFTPNTTGDPILDGDSLIFNRGISDTTFVLGNQVFTLELLGFSDDGGATIARVFAFPEDIITETQLFAQFITLSPTADVPEPATLLGSIAAGLVGIILKRRH